MRRCMLLKHPATSLRGSRECHSIRLTIPGRLPSVTECIELY